MTMTQQDSEPISTLEELEQVFERCASEAKAAFGDGTLYVEQFLPKARHVEVQIVGDGTSTSHLWDRECSLQRQRQKLVDEAGKNKIILGIFLLGTSRVGEFLDKGFTFISVGNDLHHVLTQAGAYVKDMEGIAKDKKKEWVRRPSALI